MNPATRETLREAYRLIKAGDLEAARALIDPVLAVEQDVIDAWWLAAHAAANSRDQRLALAQVLRLNPDHGPARIMLDRLNTDNPGEIDALVKEMPLPPVDRKPRLAPPPRHRTRWVWNIVLGMGCLSITFGSMALLSSFFGLKWFDDTVDDVGQALGLEEPAGERGQFGTIKGGPPGMPYDVPITKHQGATTGSDNPNLDVLEEDEAHVYTFSGQRGQEVVALLQFTVAGDAHYVMELWDANQHKLADGVGDYDSGTVTLVYALTRTGQYALVIIGRPDGPHGDYFLGIDMLD